MIADTKKVRNGRDGGQVAVGIMPRRQGNDAACRPALSSRRAFRRAEPPPSLRDYIWKTNIESKHTRDLQGDSHALAGQGRQIFPTSKFSL
jgi:hypothetical protein